MAACTIGDIHQANWQLSKFSPLSSLNNIPSFESPPLPRESPVSRFDVPWNRTPDVHLPTLAESGHRVLFSSVSSAANSGLGHMLAVMNSEVHTAMLLGLTYTHRLSSYGSLSAKNVMRVDDFFGWGRDEIPRLNVYNSVCGEKNNGTYDGPWKERGSGKKRKLRRPCMECEQIKNPGVSRDHALLGMDVRQLIQVPTSVSFHLCNSVSDPELDSLSCRAVRDFRSKYTNVSHTLFHMGAAVCDILPALSDFSRTRGWFYWRYWRAHMRQQNMLQSLRSRPKLQMSDRELSIAVHVRRGDFLLKQNKRKGRTLVSMKTFAQAVRNVIVVVQSEAGPFSALPVRVYIYSEGKRPAGSRAQDAHDVTKLSNEFVDMDGVCLQQKKIAS